MDNQRRDCRRTFTQQKKCSDIKKGVRKTPFRRKEFIMKKSLLVFIKNWWYTIPLILFLLMIAGSALVNDLCGGCVSKRGNIFYNVHDKS